MKWKINSLIESEEKKILWNESLVFAQKKKNGLIQTRCKPFFYKNDTPSSTIAKINAHAKFRYTGNIIELGFKRLLESQNKSFKTNVREIGKGDIDILTSKGLKIELKGSSKYRNIYVAKENHNQGDIFVKMFLDEKNGTIEFIGFCEKKDLIKEENREWNGYALPEYKLNKDFDKLLELF